MAGSVVTATLQPWPSPSNRREAGLATPQRDPKELAAENAHVLNLVQAMIGLISPNIRAVSIGLAGRGVRLHFLLAEEDGADREAIEDIIYEFEALHERFVDIEVTVAVSSEPTATSTVPGRLVFGRRED